MSKTKSFHPTVAPRGYVRVRIAVVVAPNGSYSASGWGDHHGHASKSDTSGAAYDALDAPEGTDRLSWVWADVPLPVQVKEKSVLGTVQEASDGCHHSVVDQGNGWGRCVECGDDGFPISDEAAGLREEAPDGAAQENSDG